MHPSNSHSASQSPSHSARLSLADFDFDLPPELIAQHPAAQRSDSRLLDGRQWPPVDRVFRELPSLLEPGDLMVFNDTQVIRARLFGHKPSGGRLELLVERVLDRPGEVVAHMKVSKKPSVGTVLAMDGGWRATLLGRWPDEHGTLFRLRLEADGAATAFDVMERHGHIPLPPYITHEDNAEDAQRYQTVFAAVPGAVAAPTAALHYDEAVLAALAKRGVAQASVTLHVGAGTFQPVKTEDIAEHRMHSEWYRIPPATLEAIEQTKARGGRVLAVGTTTLRTLESWALTGRTEGDTDIFIRPGFRFQIVDLLQTNFHLPRSTLMMLVSAFSGHRHVMDLYRHAIAQRYRFFSYGDAMLLQRKDFDVGL